MTYCIHLLHFMANPSSVSSFFLDRKGAFCAQEAGESAGLGLEWNEERIFWSEHKCLVDCKKCFGWPLL